MFINQENRMKKIIFSIALSTALMVTSVSATEPTFSHEEIAAQMGQSLARVSVLELHNMGVPLEEIQNTIGPILECTGKKYKLMVPYVDYTLGQINEGTTDEQINFWLMGIVSSLYWQCIEEQ